MQRGGRARPVPPRSSLKSRQTEAGSEARDTLQVGVGLDSAIRPRSPGQSLCSPPESFRDTRRHVPGPRRARSSQALHMVSRCRAAVTLPVPELTRCPYCTLSPCAWCPPALPAVSAGTRRANRLAIVPLLLLGSLDSILGALRVAEGAGRSYFLRLSHLYLCA